MLEKIARSVVEQLEPIISQMIDEKAKEIESILLDAIASIRQEVSGSAQGAASQVSEVLNVELKGQIEDLSKQIIRGIKF